MNQEYRNPKQLKKNTHNDIILEQYDTVFLHIVEGLVIKYLSNGIMLHSRKSFKNKFQPMTVVAKSKMYGVTKDP